MVAGLELMRNDSVAFRAQRLAGLRPRIIEFARLTDDDGAGADDEDGGDIGPFWALGFLGSAAQRARAQENGPSRPRLTRRGALLRGSRERGGSAFCAP